MDQRTLPEIDSLCDKSLLMCYKDLSLAKSLAENSLEKSEDQDYYQGMVNARIILCAIEVYRNNFDLVREKIAFIEQDLVSHASPDDCLMRLFLIRGLYFLKEGSYKDSFDAYTRAGTLAARLGNSLYCGLSDHGKGSIKLEQEEYEDAFEYFNNTLETLVSYGNSIMDGVLSLSLGCALNGLQKKGQAEETLFKALDQAAREEWGILESAVLNELAGMMLEQKNLDRAQDFLDEGIRKSRDLGNKDVFTSLMYAKARLFILQGEPDRAEAHLTKFSSDNQETLHRSYYYQLLAEIHELQGDYKKALENFKHLSAERERARGEEATKSILRQENKILQENNHQLRLISTIGQELVANLDIGRILNLIYAQMNVLMPVDLLLVALKEGNEINVKFGLKNGLRLSPVVIHKEDDDSFLAWTVRNKKEILIRDRRRESRDFVRKSKYFEDENDNPMQSIICIPLWYIHEIVGVISVRSQTQNAYTNRDLENLRALGAYAGIAIRNALQTEKMYELNEDLKKQSATDSLTGLVNRREMVKQVKHIWRVCRRNQFWVSMIMIDMDHFKKVNDEYGHGAGDAVLKRMGAILNRFFKRALDCACRYGGEELIIVTGEMPPREAAERIELIRKELSTIKFDGKEGETFQIQFSCGIYGEVASEDINKRLVRLTSVVDSYLYQAKNNGRNCTYLSDDLKNPAEKYIPSGGS